MFHSIPLAMLECVKHLEQRDAQDHDDGYAAVATPAPNPT